MGAHLENELTVHSSQLTAEAKSQDSRAAIADNNTAGQQKVGEKDEACQKLAVTGHDMPESLGMPTF